MNKIDMTIDLDIQIDEIKNECCICFEETTNIIKHREGHCKALVCLECYNKLSIISEGFNIKYCPLCRKIIDKRIIETSNTQITDENNYCSLLIYNFLITMMFVSLPALTIIGVLIYTICNSTCKKSKMEDRCITCTLIIPVNVILCFIYFYFLTRKLKIWKYHLIDITLLCINSYLTYIIKDAVIDNITFIELLPIPIGYVLGRYIIGLCVIPRLESELLE